jgi:predicted NACHT family NTPase
VRLISELLGESGCPHAVIIGDPGSGKSSLLEWLLLAWAEDPARALPLFVELRQCAREPADWKGDFCQYFAMAADSLFPFNAAELDAHVRGNDSVLLVDGLDEVFDLNQRKNLIERVLRFKGDYLRTHVVVTSRKIGFQKDSGSTTDSACSHCRILTSRRWSGSCTAGTIWRSRASRPK